MSGVCWVTGEVRYCHRHLYTNVNENHRPAQGQAATLLLKFTVHENRWRWRRIGGGRQPSFHLHFFDLARLSIRILETPCVVISDILHQFLSQQALKTSRNLAYLPK